MNFMKRLPVLLAMLLLLGIAVLVVVNRREREAPFVIGKPLPAGMIKPEIAATWDRAYLLAPDGSLWAWGGSLHGQADSQIPRRTETPQQIGTNTDWISVSAGLGPGPVFALKNDGSLWGWGNNSSGAVVPGGTNPISRPVQIGTNRDWSVISAGANHCVALRRDASLWVWGDNAYGQVGSGTVSNVATPRELMPGTRWRAIAAGAFNSYALRSDGSVWGWGLNPITGGRSNQVSPTQIGSESNWVGIAAGDYHLLALKSDGTVWIHGQNASVASNGATTKSEPGFAIMSQDKDWEKIYCGMNFSFLRKQDGSWWVCGVNDSGQFGSESRGLQRKQLQRCAIQFEPWAFTTGSATAVLLARDGTLWTWGERLGAPRRHDQVADFFQFIYRVFNKRTWQQDTTKPVTDSAPHKVWELPTAAKQMPGKP